MVGQSANHPYRPRWRSRPRGRSNQARSSPTPPPRPRQPTTRATGGGCRLHLKTNPDGGVYLRGIMSLDPYFDDIFGRIDYTDVSANRLLGPGSAGFRLVGGAVANFDDFTVKSFHVPEPTTIAVLGLGALGTVLRRRRRA